MADLHESPDPRFPYAGWEVRIYRRASKDRTKREASVTTQERRGKEWIEAQRARHAGSYTDNDLSASRFATKSRDDFERLMRDLEASSRPSLLWLWMLNRSQRDIGVYAALRNLCRRKGILWVVEGRVFDLDNAHDRRALNLTAMEDEELPETISKNSRAGLARRASDGLPHGHERYGYRRVYDPRTREYITDEIIESEADVLRNGWNWVRQHKGRIRSYVRHLADLDIMNRNGKPFPEATMRSMLMNPAYIGERHSKGKFIAKAQWEPLVEEHVFLEAQKILRDPARRTSPENPRIVVHLLSGIAKCGGKGCSKKAYGKPVGADGYARYACIPQAHASVREALADAYITELVLERLSRPNAAQLLSAPVQSEELDQARDTIAQAEKSLTEYYELVNRMELSPSGLAQVEPTLLAKIADARKFIQRSTIDPVLQGAITPDIRKRWKDEQEFPITRKRAVIDALMEITILPVGRGRRKFEPTKQFDINWRHG